MDGMWACHCRHAFFVSLCSLLCSLDRFFRVRRARLLFPYLFLLLSLLSVVFFCCPIIIKGRAALLGDCQAVDLSLETLQRPHWSCTTVGTSWLQDRAPFAVSCAVCRASFSVNRYRNSSYSMGSLSFAADLCLISTSQGGACSGTNLLCGGWQVSQQNAKLLASNRIVRSAAARGVGVNELIGL